MPRKRQDTAKAIKTVAAIASLTAIQITNMLTQNVDGMVLAGIVAAIAGLGGFAMGRKA